MLNATGNPSGDIAFEELINVHPEIKDVKEIPLDDKSCKFIYNIVGHVNPYDENNMFNLGNLEMIGGYYEVDVWGLIDSKIQTMKKITMHNNATNKEILELEKHIKKRSLKNYIENIENMTRISYVLC